MREGWPIWEIWKFKVVVFEPLFETGTMAGLIKLFGRHSEIMTNFSIFMIESRPYGSTRTGEEQVCGGPWHRAWSACGVLTDTGWTLAIPIYGYWVGTGWVLYPGIPTHPVPHCRTTPVHPPAHHSGPPYYKDVHAV